MNPDAATETTEILHCLPVAALGVDGTTPEVGDTVEYTVKGRVARMEGAEAYVMPEVVNGRPAVYPEPGTEPGGDMMAAAMAADAESDSALG